MHTEQQAKENEGWGWLIDAAGATLDAALFTRIEGTRSDDGVGASHQRYLLHSVVNGKVTGRKGHGWLCYAQGALVQLGLITKDQARAITKRALDEARLLRRGRA